MSAEVGATRLDYEFDHAVSKVELDIYSDKNSGDEK